MGADADELDVRLILSITRSLFLWFTVAGVLNIQQGKGTNSSLDKTFEAVGDRRVNTLSRIP